MDKITTGCNFHFIQKSFIEAKKALNEEKNTLVINSKRLKGIGLEGASRTGKTWDICNFVCHYVTTYTGKTINICRDFKSTLNKTTYSTLRNVWLRWGLPTEHFNKSVTPIHFNGNLINFIGINDDIMTAHGLESDLLIINEATSVAKDTFDQLEQRTNEFFIADYNPSDVDCFLFKMESREDYRILKTTIFDNKYAPNNAKQKILSYAHPDVNDFDMIQKYGYEREEWEQFKQKNLRNETADSFLWQVYGLGLRAVSEDVIFTKGFELYSESPTNYDWKVYGGDFGYSNDPSVMVELIKDGHNLYLKELIYQTGLLSADLAHEIKKGGWIDSVSVWDSADGFKSVNELIANGVDYADGAVKGAGSIYWGLENIKKYKIHIHKDSLNLQEEFRIARWAKDRNGSFKRDTKGRRIPHTTNPPKDHCLDSVRYGLGFYESILTDEN